MLLNVLGLFVFESFTATDVVQPFAVYDRGPKAVDQERTLNCFSIMPGSFTTFQSSSFLLVFSPKFTYWHLYTDAVGYRRTWKSLVMQFS